MTDLEARRAALLLESELNRQALRLEIARTQVAVERLRAGVFSGQNIWKWVAPVAGFVLARKFGPSGTAATGTALFSVGRTLWNAWKERRRSRAQDAAKS